MKLCLKGHEYKFAVEQIMLAMFPGEKPEYTYNFEKDGRSACISLKKGGIFSTVYVIIAFDGKCGRGFARIKTKSLEMEEDRLAQRLIKTAFYKAAVTIKGQKPVWGCLTGVRPCKILEKMVDEGSTQTAAIGRLQREYFVAPEKAQLCGMALDACLKVKRELDKKDIALYIGIPFCPTRCAYCSFVSQSVEKSTGYIEPFLHCLYSEIEAAARAAAQCGLNVISVYFGGGTPTTLSENQLDELLDKLYAEFDLTCVKDFTVEAGRPDTITEGKLRVLKKYGVSRISVNPQTMSDRVLNIIGRYHTAADIVSAFEMARNVGIENINMDIIAGLPGDSVEGYRNTLDKVLELDPENITVHTLSLKKGSRIMTENMPIPGQGEVAEMLRLTSEKLSGSGYSPYYLYRQKYMSGGFENTGWAKPGTENLYNILIMEELCSIISMGGGASTKFVDMQTGKIQRIFNPKYPKEYIEGIDSVNEKKKSITDFYLNKE